MVGRAGMYMSTAKGVNVVNAPNRKISSTRRSAVMRAGSRLAVGRRRERGMGRPIRRLPRPWASPAQIHPIVHGRARLWPLRSAPMRDSPGPFSAYEWMIALRYLRARRKEGFASFITVISLIGIALGVATLIIVMS